MFRLTRAQVMRRSVFAAILLSSAVGSVYCAWRHYSERAWLAATARQVVREAGASTPYEEALALRDFLRRKVTYKGAEHDNRPYLRATARETIESGLGYCGESSRAFVLLAHELGLRSQRVNLHGRLPHVVAEVEVSPGRHVLFDPQNNPDFNAYFDNRDLTADELIVQTGSPFRGYSNLNFRRVPILGAIILRVRTQDSRLTRTLESPWLILAYACLAVTVVLTAAGVADRVIIQHYARRLGVAGPGFVRFVRSAPAQPPHRAGEVQAARRRSDSPSEDYGDAFGPRRDPSRAGAPGHEAVPPDVSAGQVGPPANGARM